MTDERSSAASLAQIGGFRPPEDPSVQRSAPYLLSEAEARAIVDQQIDVIETHWTDVCEEARLSEVDRAGFWRRQFLNPYAVEGY